MIIMPTSRTKALTMTEKQKLENKARQKGALRTVRTLQRVMKVLSLGF